MNCDPGGTSIWVRHVSSGWVYPADQCLRHLRLWAGEDVERGPQSASSSKGRDAAPLLDPPELFARVAHHERVGVGRLIQVDRTRIDVTEIELLTVAGIDGGG